MVGATRRGMEAPFGRGADRRARHAETNRAPRLDGEAPRLRISGAHAVDRYLIVEWFSRLSEATTYRHLWWLGHS